MTDIQVGAELVFCYLIFVGIRINAEQPENQMGQSIHHENNRCQYPHQGLDHGGVGKGKLLSVDHCPVFRHNLTEQQHQQG